MGLLDMFNGEEGLLGAFALMSAGSAKPQRTSFAEGLLGSMQTMQQAKAAKEDRAMKRQQFEAQQQAQALELQRYQQQMQEQQRKAQEAGRIQSLLQQSFMPTRPIDANAASGVTGPRPEALAAGGQMPQVNYQQLLAQGVPPEIVKALSEARNYGRDKVARTLEVRGPDGMPMIQREDDYGGVVGQNSAKPVEMRLENMGGHSEAINPFALQPGQRFNRSMTPDAQAANAIARGNLGIAQERLAMDKANGGGEKTPSGYRWVNGGLEAIPGGPAAGNKPLTEAQAKATTFLGQMRAASATLGQISPDQSSWMEQANVALAGTPGNVLASEKGQQTRQAQEQWAEAFLRFKTGAASTEGEVKRNVRTFFPQMGDTQATIAQKQRMREQAEADIAIAAGQGAQQAQLVPSIASRSGAQQQGAPRRITGDADYNALPSGSTFIGPDGVTRRKP